MTLIRRKFIDSRQRLRCHLSMASSKQADSPGVQIIKSFFKYLLLLVLAVWLGLSSAQRKAHAADDDWEAVGSSSSGPAERSDQSTSGAQDDAAHAQTKNSSAKPFKVCGEMATKASPQVTAMVQRINNLWGSSFPVYETLAVEQPHATPGGCVFYNRAALAAILAGRLDVQDNTEVIDPLEWAIFAHEIGHQVHQDNERVRDSVPSAIKELEADRFAGYTLARLKIRGTELSPYWSLTGDEFGGGANSRNAHGSSGQRLAAFKQGWNLAEWNRPEGSGSVAEAQNEAVAPDSADGAPK